MDSLVILKNPAEISGRHRTKDIFRSQLMFLKGFVPIYLLNCCSDANLRTIKDASNAHNIDKQNIFSNREFLRVIRLITWIQSVRSIVKK